MDLADLKRLELWEALLAATKAHTAAVEANTAKLEEVRVELAKRKLRGLSAWRPPEVVKASQGAVSIVFDGEADTVELPQRFGGAIDLDAMNPICQFETTVRVIDGDSARWEIKASRADWGVAWEAAHAAPLLWPRGGEAVKFDGDLWVIEQVTNDWQACRSGMMHLALVRNAIPVEAWEEEVARG